MVYPPTSPRRARIILLLTLADTLLTCRSRRRSGPAPYFATATGTALLTTEATLFMSATSCAFRLTLRPFAPAGVPASSIALITTPRTANALDIGRLGANQGSHRLDGRGIGLCLLQNRKDVRFDELCSGEAKS